MRIILVLAAAVAVLGGQAAAQQEEKPVPKDSVRISIAGCSKGLVFTAGPRTEEEPGSPDVPEGSHLRMHGPKKMINDIKAHQGSMIELTGLVRKDLNGQTGVRIGPGIRIGPANPIGGGLVPGAMVDQPVIDVEGWRQIDGVCPR
jgi:hypothetical protein